MRSDNTSIGASTTPIPRKHKASLPSAEACRNTWTGGYGRGLQAKEYLSSSSPRTPNHHSYLAQRVLALGLTGSGAHLLSEHALHTHASRLLHDRSPAGHKVCVCVCVCVC